MVRSSWTSGCPAEAPSHSCVAHPVRPLRASELDFCYSFAMAGRMWVFSPNRGGQKIPPLLQAETRERILKHAGEIVPEKASQIRVSFRGHFCYIDAEEPGCLEPLHLCRLRYMGGREPKAWSVDFYTYSHEKYEPCVFASGEFLGTPEEALEIGAEYLT
jgi:hypothetical protein